ncbi:MAG: hypothetical protein HY553_03230 [Elusimicrobia bacterium]|nr:hypothetical protein [Elusimicrobiota bacterium]
MRYLLLASLVSWSSVADAAVLGRRPRRPYPAATAQAKSVEPVWPHCGVTLPFGPPPPDGTPCSVLFPEPVPFHVQYPHWAAYAASRGITPRSQPSQSGCPDVPPSAFGCWSADEIARFGMCVGSSFGGVVVWGKVIDDFFARLARGQQSESSARENVWNIGAQLCLGYCEASPGAAGCEYYPNDQGDPSPLLLLVGEDGRKATSFRAAEPMTILAVFRAGRARRFRAPRLLACAAPAGEACPDSAFVDIATAGFECEYRGNGSDGPINYVCRRARSALADGVSSGTFTGYFRDAASGAAAEVTYNVR